MRRSPSTDVRTELPAGATATSRFDSAYRELARARAAYDAALGDPDRVPDLAIAAARLDAARWAMQAVTRAA